MVPHRQRWCPGKPQLWQHIRQIQNPTDRPRLDLQHRLLRDERPTPRHMECRGVTHRGDRDTAKEA